MANSTLPPIDEISNKLRYDERTGDLIWRKRDVSMFPVGRRRNNACAIWNSQYAGKIAGGVSRDGYVRVGFGKRLFLAHRLIWAMHHGDPQEAFLDHINGDKTDNRIENLRIASLAENNRNLPLRSNNTSGCVGVSPYRGKWRATISKSGKQHIIGYFEDLEEAKAARKSAERAYGYHRNHGRLKASPSVHSADRDRYRTASLS